MKKINNRNQITTTKDKTKIVFLGLLAIFAIIVISVLIANAGANIEAQIMN